MPGLTIAGLAGFAWPRPLGMLGDRIGAQRPLVAMQLWRALMLVAPCFVTGAPTFLSAAAGPTIALRSAGGWELSFHRPRRHRGQPQPGIRRRTAAPTNLAAVNLGPAAQDIDGPLPMTAVVARRYE